MDNSNILKESTLKLKTKVLLFSGVSLFIGLTKALPTKLSLIGLNFESTPTILGWFLIAITTFFLSNFIIILNLDIIEYFKKNIINGKAKNLTGDTIGFTYEEIDDEYNRQNEYNENYQEPRGSLSDEAEDIHRKIKILENDFDNKHLKFTNIIELFFNALVPIVLALFSLVFLYNFLTQELNDSKSSKNINTANIYFDKDSIIIKRTDTKKENDSKSKKNIHTTSIHFEKGSIIINRTDAKKELDNLFTNEINKNNHYIIKLTGFSSTEIVKHKNTLSNNYQISLARANNVKKYILDIFDKKNFNRENLFIDTFAYSNQDITNDKTNQHEINRKVIIEIIELKK
ncbi:MAG: hypothetical protein WBF48_00770 [Halarcobacter sp.]